MLVLKEADMKERVKSHKDHSEDEQERISVKEPVRIIEKMPCHVQDRHEERNDPQRKCYSHTNAETLGDVGIHEE